MAGQVFFVGSVKWRDHGPADARDLASLAASALRVPGTDADTPLVVVSREPAHSSLTDAPGITALNARDLMAAWES